MVSRSLRYQLHAAHSALASRLVIKSLSTSLALGGAVLQARGNGLGASGAFEVVVGEAAGVEFLVGPVLVVGFPAHTSFVSIWAIVLTGRSLTSMYRR